MHVSAENSAPVAADTLATATPPTPNPVPGEICKQARFHEFDFWIGEWEVFGPAGKKVGENRISVVNKGCTLAEHWTNTSGGEGRSYNALDAATKTWHQFWSDDQGGTLWLSGGLREGAMVMEGESPSASTGKPQRQRISWTPNADGSVRQLWETSDDGGASWQVSFDGHYRRRGNTTAE